jgi:hypothetical protein
MINDNMLAEEFGPFGPLANAAVAEYLDRLDTALPTTDSTAQVCDQVRKLIENDLREAFTWEFAGQLAAGRGVRVSAKEALEYFCTLLDGQLEYIVRQIAVDEADLSGLRACQQSYAELTRQVANENFPSNFDALVAVETRRLAGVPLSSPPRQATDRLFPPAPHDSLWPKHPRPRLIDENSVNAPTYRPGSYYHH